MKIVITGGAGYVGCSLVETLLHETGPETEIVVYDNLSRNNFQFFFTGAGTRAIRFVQGDILDRRKLAKTLEGADVVYHLCARVTTPNADTDSHSFEQINHWGTAELVSCLEDAPVKRLIHLSSTAVYGRSETPVDESSEVNPQSFYAHSKARAEEQLLRLRDTPVETLVVRSGNVYGYNRSVRFDAVINRFVFNAVTQGRLRIHGDGTQQRAFIHVHKLSEVLAALRTTRVPAGTYNLAEHNLCVNEIAEALQQFVPDLEYLFINQHITMREISVQVPVKLLAFAQWSPQTLDEELQAFVSRFRNTRAG